MQLLIKIAIFIGFLVSYLAYWAVIWLVDSRRKLTQPAQTEWDWFLNIQFLTIWPYLLLVVPIYLLAGELPWTLALLFIAAGEVSVFVAALAMGMGQSRWQMLASWQMLRSFAQRPMLVLAEFGVIVLSILVFPLAAGVIFFTQARPSAGMTLLTFQAVLVLLFFSAIPVVVLAAASTLSSPYVDESTRIRFLIAQSAAMTPTTLAAAVALWAFGAAGSGTTLSSGSVSIVISPRLALFTAAYLLLVLIVPYAIGSQRAKARRLEFLDERRGLLNTAREAIALPDRDRRMEALQDLAQDVDGKIQILSAGDPSPQLLAENRAASPDRQRSVSRLVPSPLNLNVRGKPWTDAFYAGSPQQVTAAYDASLEEDSRLQHLTWMNKFASDLASAREQLGRGGRQLARVVSEWKESFATTQDTVKDEIAEASRARTPLGFIAVSFLGPLFSSVFVTGFGGWLWSTFEHTVLK